MWILFLLLASCAGGGSHVMTMDSFADISIGTKQNSLVERMGEPYAIHKKEEGALEYEYIERIRLGSREVEERHYFLLIRNGEVVSKRVTQRSPSPLGFDSYEMQTSQAEF